MWLRTVLALGASFLLASSSANAQGYVAPAIGITFGNPSSSGRPDFVVDVGGVSQSGRIGAEVDVTYAPNFFGSGGPFGDNRVTTAMVNLIFAGGSQPTRFFNRSRSGVRPYASAGVGIMHEAVSTETPPVHRISNTDFGLNGGVGVMAFSNGTFGFRLDVRYFRDLADNNQGNMTNVDFGSFHFWRASAGVIVAF